MTYTLLSEMKIILLFAVLAICGFFAYRDWYAVPEPPAPTPTPAPTPQVRLAPEGVFYVTKAFSMQTSDGIKGFPVLKEVRRIREEGEDLIVSDGEAEGRAPKANFTNNLDVVDLIRKSLPPAMPIPVAENSPVSLEIAKTSREITAAEIELERIQGAIRRTDSRLSKTGERVSRGEVYDSLTDLREVAKELEKKRSDLEATRDYWSEMTQKLQRYKTALEESQRLEASLRNGTQDVERARHEVAGAEARARASSAVLEAHRASQQR